MSGIVGVRALRTPIAVGSLDDALGALKHRGPDGEAQEQDAGGKESRDRLAVHDSLSACAQNPTDSPARNVRERG